MTSLSNTITPDNSGITGLTVTAAGTGSTTVTVGSDTSAVKTAITTVRVGLQHGAKPDSNRHGGHDGFERERDARHSHGRRHGGEHRHQIEEHGLFSRVGTQWGGHAIERIGVRHQQHDNTLSLSDSTALDNALANNMNDVKAFFTTASTGVAAQFNTYLATTVGGPESGVEGTLPQVRDSLTAQSQDITTQIATIETRVTADQTRMINEFTNMEEIRTQLNTDLSYLESCVWRQRLDILRGHEFLIEFFINFFIRLIGLNTISHMRILVVVARVAKQRLARRFRALVGGRRVLALSIGTFVAAFPRWPRTSKTTRETRSAPESRLPREVRRVAVLPIAGENTDPDMDFGQESLQPVLVGELNKRGLFELVVVTPEQLTQWTGKSHWSAAEKLPSQLLERLRDDLGCDAVLFARLSQYKPYPPLAMGWNLQLVLVDHPQHMLGSGRSCSI